MRRPSPTSTGKTCAQRLEAIGFPTDKIPNQFLDTITAAIMENPWLSTTGRTFDITTFAKLKQDPITKQNMEPSMLNQDLKSEIEDFVNQQEQRYNKQFKARLKAIDFPDNKIPPRYLDKKTGQLMEEPWVSNTGWTYDKSTFEAFRSHPAADGPAIALTPNQSLTLDLENFVTKQEKKYQQRCQADASSTSNVAAVPPAMAAVAASPIRAVTQAPAAGASAAAAPRTTPPPSTLFAAAPSRNNDSLEPIPDVIRRKTLHTMPPTVSVADFRQYIAEGKETPAAMAYEGSDLNWLIQRGHIEDKAGRIFENTSGLEYSLWALDEFMWERMIDDVARQKLATIDPSAAYEFCSALLAQYHRVKNEGLTYTLPSQEGSTSFIDRRKTRANEKHFNFRPHINALQVLIDNSDLWTPDQIKSHWCTVIGGKYGTQWWLPEHATHEYFRRDSAFDPCPAFRARLINNGIDHRNYLTEENQDWYSCLNDGFGIAKTSDAFASRRSQLSPASSRADLNASQTLFEVRLHAFYALEQKLLDLQARFAPQHAEQLSY